MCRLLLCALLISLLVACVAAQQCAPTFPALATCVYSGVPPPGVNFYIDLTQSTWVEPTLVNMVIRPDLTVVYSVAGQFTHYPPGGTQFTVNSLVSWTGYWGTYSPTGESCGCSCSGNLLLSAVSASSVAACVDSYASVNPGVYNFCTNYRFLNYYFSGDYRWALDQDATNRFLILSKPGAQPGSLVGSSFVPYTSTPSAFWGEPVMYLAESGTC